MVHPPTIFTWDGDPQYHPSWRTPASPESGFFLVLGADVFLPASSNRAIRNRSCDKQGRGVERTMNLGGCAEPDIVAYLEPVTAAIAGPGMTDVMFAHELRPVWRNQSVIAADARNSIGRMSLGRNDHHDGPP